MLTKSQLLLAAELLEFASESFSNRVCNDYVIEDTPENREWLIRCEMENNPNADRATAEEDAINPYNGALMCQDWLLMTRLADALKQEATQ